MRISDWSSDVCSSDLISCNAAYCALVTWFDGYDYEHAGTVYPGKHPSARHYCTCKRLVGKQVFMAVARAFVAAAFSAVAAAAAGRSLDRKSTRLNSSH